MYLRIRQIAFALIAFSTFLFQSAHAQELPIAPDYSIGNQSGVDNGATPESEKEYLPPADDVSAAAAETSEAIEINENGQILDSTNTGKVAERAKKFADKAEKYIAKVNDDKNLIERAIQKQMQLLSKISTALHELSISFTAKQTINISSKVGLSVGYSYDTSPAYIGKYWYRQDGYFVSLPVHLGDFIKKKVAQFNITPGIILEYTRFYPSDSDAKTAGPVWPDKFPVNSEKALQMQPGDLAHSQAYVNGIFGPGFAWQILRRFSIHPELDYLRNARVDAFIFRADESKVRIRLIAHNQRSIMAQGQFGVNANFSPFALNLLTNAVIHALRLDQIWLGQTIYGRQNIYLGDYILDLSKPEVAGAYDRLFKKLGLVKDVPIDQSVLQNLLNPFRSIEQMGLALKENLAELDSLYLGSMAEKDRRLRAVDRIFAGSDSVKDKPASQHKLGLQMIARDEGTRVRRDNSLLRESLNPEKGIEDKDFFFFPTWAKTDDWRAGFSLIRRTEVESSNIIYQSNKSFVPTDFKSIGFYLDYTTKTYDDKEHQKKIAHFKQLLPPDVYTLFYEKLVKDNFTSIPNGGKIKNVRVKARYFINAKGLDVAQKVFDGEEGEIRLGHMRQLIINHLSAIPTTTYASRNLQETAGGVISLNSCAPVYKNEPAKVKAVCNEIEAIAKALLIVIDKTKKPLERHDQMDHLSKDPLFLEAGPGILMSVLPSGDINQATFFEISIFLPTRVEPIRFTYPEKVLPEREFYETLLDIQNVLNNQTPDMRLEGSTDDLTHRKTHDPENGDTFKH